MTSKTLVPVIDFTEVNRYAHLIMNYSNYLIVLEMSHLPEMSFSLKQCHLMVI